MPDNYYSEVNDHGNVIPIKDLAAVAWADAEKSVKQNMFNYEAWKGIHVEHGTGEFINNGIDLTSTADACYTSFDPDGFPVPIPVKEGDKIKITWDLGANSASGEVLLFPNGQATSGGQIVYVSVANTAKILKYTVPSGVTFITFRVGVARSGNVAHYKNIMVTYDDVPVDVTKYVPYIPDNTELMLLEDNAVLGAWNIFTHDIAANVNVTKTSDNDAMVLTATGGGAYITFYPIHTKVGKKYKLTLKYKVSIVGSNLAIVVTKTPNMSAVIAQELIEASSSEYIDFSLEFTADVNTLGIAFFINRSGSTNANVLTVKDVMVSPATADLPYVEPAMTNRELTEKVQGIIDAASNAADFAAFKTAIGNL